MTERLDAVSFGALNIDELRQVQAIVPNGEMEPLGAGRASGGSHANTMYALSKLGHHVAVIGAVGYDAAEKGVLDDFYTTGVSTQWVTVKEDMRTGEALTVTDRSSRMMLLSPGANSAYNSIDLARAISEGATHTRLLHLTSFVDKTQLAIQLELVENLGPESLVSFSPGALYVAHGLGQLALLLNRTDYLIGNPSEVSQLAEIEEWRYEDAAQCLLTHFPHIRAVAVTMGEGRHRDNYLRRAAPDPLGRITLDEYFERQNLKERDPILSSVIFTHDERVNTEQTPLIDDVVDTTGAGDAWTAGLLHGILDGHDLEVCGLMGDLVAQSSLTRLGARAGLPTLDQLNYKLARISTVS